MNFIIIIFVTTRAVLEVVRGLSYKLWLTTSAGKRLWSRVLVKVRLTVIASSCTAATDCTPISYIGLILSSCMFTYSIKAYLRYGTLKSVPYHEEYGHLLINDV